MNATTTVEIKGVGTLTTDHATSSYGIPVLLIDGVPHGPADRVRGLNEFFVEVPDARTAREALEAYSSRAVTTDSPRRNPVGMKFSELTRVEMTPAEMELIRKFIA